MFLDSLVCVSTIPPPRLISVPNTLQNDCQFSSLHSTPAGAHNTRMLCMDGDLSFPTTSRNTACLAVLNFSDNQDLADDARKVDEIFVSTRLLVQLHRCRPAWFLQDLRWHNLPSFKENCHLASSFVTRLTSKEDHVAYTVCRSSISETKMQILLPSCNKRITKLP